MDSTPIIESNPIAPPTPALALPETYIVCYPILNSTGDTTLSVQISFDITPRRTAEAALYFARHLARKTPGAVILHYVPEAK